ncbi:MAG: YfhO family protein [Candidatus Symbiothrix sp.]|nr:YfhO family protein [Candidatus Symbiothrix sp.]
MIKTVFQKSLPHLAAIVLFLALSVVYFYPALQGKDLVQSDLTSGMGWGADANKAVQETGEYPFWSNSMFGGMPGNYTGGMPPTYNIFNYLAQVFTLRLPTNHIGLLFIYLLGFYIFLMVMGCKPWLGIVGAIAYAFASYNLIIIDAGHVSKALVMATMAPVLGGVVLTYRGKYLWGALITLIFTGINIAWSHQQISYYLMLIIAVLVVVYLIYAIRERRLKQFFMASAVLAVSALLAALPAVGSLIPTMDYTKETMRGGAVLQQETDEKSSASGLDIDYAYAWSYGKAETLTLLIPNFNGASSHYNIGKDSKTYEALRHTGQAAQFARYAPMYWGGKPFTSGPNYAGAIVCFLFILGLFIVKGREKWWLLGATILSVILAWGKNFPAFNEFIFYHLPLYNKFRTPEMALVMAGVTMAILATLTLKVIIERRQDPEFVKQFTRPFQIALGISGGLCLLIALFGGSFDYSATSDASYPDWLLDAFYADRRSMLVSDAWRSLIFILLAAACVLFFIKNKLKTPYLLLALGVLILIDLWSVDIRFLNNDHFVPKRKAKAIEATAADRQIQQDTDPNYRVLNLASNTFNESATSYFHNSVGGYSPAKLRRYQDIIDYHFSKKLNMNVLNMLNTRYVITAQDGKQQVQMNPEALGNCWFVDTLRWVDSPNEEISALYDFNPAETAVVDTAWQSAVPASFPTSVERDSTARIVMTNYYTPGHIYYESHNSQPQLAVFSEVYYKTWKAYIDGEETPLIRANYILRALPIPAGDHQIEMRCVDELFLSCARFSLISSWAIGLIIAALLVVICLRTKKS